MEKLIHEDEILGKIQIQGIGKFVLTAKDDNNFNIPSLHFITFYSEDKYCTSLCLELNISYTHKDYEMSIELMLKANLDYINSSIKKQSDMDKLISLVSSKDNEDFWALYRKAEFSLAKYKMDVSSKFIQEIQRNAIAEYIKENFILENLQYTEINDKKVA